MTFEAVGFVAYDPETDTLERDPRGPVRTIASVEQTPTATLVVFAECGHTAEKNPTMTFRTGESSRCFRCRVASNS